MLENGITDRQIADLMDKAAREGDHDLVHFCEVALGVGDHFPSPEEQWVAKEECAFALLENDES